MFSIVVKSKEIETGSNYFFGSASRAQRTLMEDFGDYIQTLPDVGLDFLYFDKQYEDSRPPTNILDPVEEDYFLNYKDFYLLPDAILDPFLVKSKPVTILKKDFFKKKPKLRNLMDELGYDDSWLDNKPLPEIVPEIFAYLKRWEDKAIPIPVLDKDAQRYLSEHTPAPFPKFRTEIIGDV